MSRSSLITYEYPKSHPNNGNSSMDKMRPVKLTFEFLKETVDTVMKKILAGDWTETSVKTYAQ